MAARVYAGRHGIFTCADEAVAAATRGLRAACSERPIEDRKRIIDHIRRISIDQCVELGTMEMEETKIGRLEHKIEKLKTLGERTPGVEFLRSEVFSGDHGLAVIEHAPFGVIGAITPVTHSLPTITGNAISMIAAGNTVVVNPHPSGKQSRGRRACADSTRRSTSDLGIDNLICVIAEPTLETANAIVRPSRHQDDLRDRRAGRRPRSAATAASGRSSPGRAIRRWWSMKRPISITPRGASFAGRSYDNNLLCIAEKEVFVVEQRLRPPDGGDGTGRRGAAERSRGGNADEECDISVGEGDHKHDAPAKDFLGQDAAVLAKGGRAKRFLQRRRAAVRRDRLKQSVRACRTDDAVRAVRPLPRCRRSDRSRPRSTSMVSATPASSTRHNVQEHDADGPASWTPRCS